MTEALPSAGPRRKALGLLALCRVSNLPTVWMNVLAAVVLSKAPAGGGVVLLLAASLSAFYCAGMALNDLCDRDFDAVEQPFRPIPSGRLRVAEATTATVALFALGFGLLLLAPRPGALAPALVLLGFIAAYDRFHKAHPASVFLMAGCRTLVFVVSAWAVAGTVAPLVWAAGALQFAWTLLVTVVARFEHTRGERYSFPLIPRMIAGMSVLDGLVLAVFASPLWILAGVAAAGLTHLGQRYVRGD